MHPPLSPPLRAPAGPPSATPSSGSGIAAQRQDRSHRPPLALALPLPPLPPVIGSGSACASDVDDHDHDHDHDHHVLLDASPHAPSLGHGHGRSDSGSCCNHLSTYTATRRRPEDHTTHAPPSSASSAASASISCASTTLLNRPPPPLPNPPLPVAFQSWFKHLRRSPLSTLSHTLSLWPLCRSRHDLALFALAWTYFSLCSYITCLANSTVDRYNPNNVVPIEQRTVLMDPGMQTLATAYATYVHGPRDVSDWFVRLCSVLMVTRAVLHRERAATVLRRACYVGGTLYLLRAQTVLMTVLPNPLLECESKPHANVWYDAYLLFTQQRASCGDVFFSGHSIIFMTNLNLWWVFGRNWAAKLAAMLTSIIAVISLLASSYHYSIDVWTACILCLTTFFLYQWTATGQIGHGTWWGSLIQLIDGDERFRAQACLSPSAGSSPCILPSTHHALTAALVKPACASCAAWWDHYEPGRTNGAWWMPGSRARLPRYQRVVGSDEALRADEDEADLVSVVSASSAAGGGNACRVAPLVVRSKPVRTLSHDSLGGEGVSASAPAREGMGVGLGGMSVPRRASLMAQRPGYPRLGAGVVAGSLAGRQAVVGTAPAVGMSAAHLPRADEAQNDHDEDEQDDQSVTGGGTSQVWRQ